MQKQTQTHAEKVEQEREGHTRSAFRVGILGPGQVSPAEGQRSGRENSTKTRLEPLSLMQICDEVRFCRLDKRVTLNIVSLLVLEALSQTESGAQVRTGPTDS